MATMPIHRTALATLILTTLTAAPALAQSAGAPGGSDPCAPGRATLGAGPGGTQLTAPNVKKDQNLSEHLAQSGGVICPPANVDPQIRAPTPEVGRMPVIPPP